MALSARAMLRGDAASTTGRGGGGRGGGRGGGGRGRGGRGAAGVASQVMEPAANRAPGASTKTGGAEGRRLSLRAAAAAKAAARGGGKKKARGAQKAAAAATIQCGYKYSDVAAHPFAVLLPYSVHSYGLVQARAYAVIS